MPDDYVEYSFKRNYVSKNSFCKHSSLDSDSEICIEEDEPGYDCEE